MRLASLLPGFLEKKLILAWDEYTNGVSAPNCYCAGQPEGCRGWAEGRGGGRSLGPQACLVSTRLCMRGTCSNTEWWVRSPSQGPWGQRCCTACSLRQPPHKERTRQPFSPAGGPRRRCPIFPRLGLRWHTQRLTRTNSRRWGRLPSGCHGNGATLLWMLGLSRQQLGHQRRHLAPLCAQDSPKKPPDHQHAWRPASPPRRQATLGAALRLPGRHSPRPEARRRQEHPALRSGLGLSSSTAHLLSSGLLSS